MTYYKDIEEYNDIIKNGIYKIYYDNEDINNKSIFYNKNEDLPKYVIYKEYLYSNNQLEQIKTFFRDGILKEEELYESGKLRAKITYFYNSIKKIYTIEKYDDNFNSNVTRYYESGNIKYTGNYIYCKIKDVLYKDNNHNTYYDCKNKKLESTELYDNNNLLHLILFDKKGNIIKEYGPSINY